jgi:hypothetical protein
MRESSTVLGGLGPEGYNGKSSYSHGMNIWKTTGRLGATRTVFNKYGFITWKHGCSNH